MNLIPFILIVLFNFAISNSASVDPKNVDFPDWESPNITVENEQLVQERSESERILINNVAYRGTAVTDYQIGLRQMNLLMRENYKKMIDRVGHNVYPLIVATDVDHGKRLSGTGSEYILFLRNGTIRNMKLTPTQYEQNKNLAHLPLSIFSIISPYFNNPTSPMWHKDLSELRLVVSNNLIALNLSTKATKPLRTSSVFCDNNLTLDDHRTMLETALNYLNKCFDSKSVDMESYTNITGTYLPYCKKALACAAQIQAQAATIELTKWKNLLGKKEWRELYVLYPVIWPVSRQNPRQLIFEKLMDKDRTATLILKTEGAQSVEEARTTAGRIIADRTLAHFVFGYGNREHVGLNLALSTRRDLLASKANEYLNPPKPNGTFYLGVEKEADMEVDPNDLHFQNEY